MTTAITYETDVFPVHDKDSLNIKRKIPINEFN